MSDPTRGDAVCGAAFDGAYVCTRYHGHIGRHLAEPKPDRRTRREQARQDLYQILVGGGSHGRSEEALDEYESAIIVAQAAQIARLRAALRQHGHHDKHCNDVLFAKWRAPAVAPCTCGLDAALKETQP